MKKIMLSIRNSLMAQSIANSLEESKNFHVTSRSALRDIGRECARDRSDILLMEAAYGTGFSMEDCLKEAEELHYLSPGCRVILLCDENSVPEIARQVVCAKMDGLIDDFIYSSVSESYLTALLSAM